LNADISNYKYWKNIELDINKYNLDLFTERLEKASQHNYGWLLEHAWRDENLNLNLNMIATVLRRTTSIEVAKHKNAPVWSWLSTTETAFPFILTRQYASCKTKNTLFKDKIKEIKNMYLKWYTDYPILMSNINRLWEAPREFLYNIIPQNKIQQIQLSLDVFGVVNSENFKAAQHNAEPWFITLNQEHQI